MKRAGRILLNLFKLSLIMTMLLLAGCDQLPFLPGSGDSGPALTVARFEVSPTETLPGGTLLVDLLIINRGNQPAQETLTHFRLNSDASGTSSADVRLLGVPTPALEPDASYSFQRTVTIPDSLERGIHYLWVQLDALSPPESQEPGSRALNAINVLETVDENYDEAQLAVELFQVSPAELQPGGIINLDLQISNRGEQHATGTTAHIRLSDDPDRTADSDYLLTEVAFPALAPGGREGTQQSLTIPESFAPGVYYVWVQLDALDESGSRAAEVSRARNPILLLESLDTLPNATCANLPLTASGGRARTSHISDWPVGDGSSLSLTALELDLPHDTPRADDPAHTAPSEWNNRYPGPRSYFTFACGDRLGFIWQPSAGRDAVVTVATADFGAEGSWLLPLNGDRLVAAAYGDDSFYYVTMGTGTDITRSAMITVHRVAPATGGYLNYVLDTSRAAFNSVESDRPWSGHASLAYNDGQLGLIMNRLMHRSEDGLNHQGAFGAVFDASSLELLTNLGQTSGHSFGSYLVPAAGGGFLGIDHGDNYPRGVHLHKFTEQLSASRVVYTFKTLHGTIPANSAGVTFPVYDQISTPEQTFYQWSNDNNIYGELGASLELDNGIAVLFIGEPGPGGESLDNARTGELLNDARNVGVVLVRHDFETASQGEGRNVVTDDLMLSTGAGSVSETGGFYNFNGGWDPQRNAGVRWLTDYSDAELENASRLQAARLGPDTVLLAWEVWTPTDYRETYVQVVNSAGQELLSPTRVSDLTDLRLFRSDDPLETGDAIYLTDGSATGIRVWRFRME